MTANPIQVDLPKSSGRLTKVWTAGTLTYTTTGLVVLFAWLLWGDFAWSLRDRTVGPALQLLLKKFSASDMLVGILMSSLPTIVGMFLHPVVSYQSDRLRGRWGRRIPFLIASTPIVALSMVGLGFSPALGLALHKYLGNSSPGVDPLTVFFLGVFWMGFEISTTVANAVFGGLLSDVVPRQFFGRFLGAFRALSLLVGIFFNYWLFGKIEMAYFWIFIAMGTLYGGGFSLMCLNVKEGEYPPPAPARPGQGPKAFFLTSMDYFKKCFGKSYYWWIYANTTLMWMGLGQFNLYNLYYAKSLAMDLDIYGRYLALTFAISLVLAYPLGALADRFHPLRVVLVAQAIYVVSTFASGIYANDAWTFGIALVSHGVMAGTLMTASSSLYLRLLPKDNYAQYASAGGIVGSVLAIFFSPCVGMFLDHTHHTYRYIFFISGGLGLASLLAGLGLYFRFLALGGTKNYVAPE